MVRHLRRQGCKSMNETNTLCAYRGQNGNMCAVGAIIPNNLYKPKMENKTIYGLLNDSVNDELKEFFGELDISLLNAMQRTHDQVPPYRWNEYFKSIASVYNLSIPD